LRRRIALRRDLDQFVVRDELDRGLERQLDRRHQVDRSSLPEARTLVSFFP
jgi:hypothetical protein